MQATDEQVMRSIATAAILLLNGKDPTNDFSEYQYLPVNTYKRAIVQYANQELPVSFGPMNSFLVPSVMVEYGPAGNDKGIVDRPVILSMSRMASENSIERELVHLGAHSALLRPFVFGSPTDTKCSCPVYVFEDNTPLPIDIVGLVVWRHPALRNLPPPFDRTILGVDGGGWIRKEFHFTAHYQLG